MAIQLGNPGALRDYPVLHQGDGISWSRTPANPYAAKVQSSGKFDEVDAWNEWVQEDWQAGIGRIDPEAGGMGYAEIDSRVPNQLLPSPFLSVTDQDNTLPPGLTTRSIQYRMDATRVIGAGSTEKKVAALFETPALVNLQNGAFLGTQWFYVYCRVPKGVVLRLSIYSATAGTLQQTLPDTLIVSSTVQSQETTHNFYWWGLPLSTAGLAASTKYFLVAEPSDPDDYIVVPTSVTGAEYIRTYNGTTWTRIFQSGVGGQCLQWMSDFYTLNESTFAMNTSGMTSSTFATKFVRFNNKLYQTRQSRIWRWYSPDWRYVTAVAGGTINSVAVFGPKLYLATSLGLQEMNVNEVVSTTTGTNVPTGSDLLLVYDGYLYCAFDNKLWYTADGATWIGPFLVGNSDVSIRGMAGMDDSLYLSTDKALMRLAPGDIVDEVQRWGSERSDNGLNMVSYRNSLYIPVAGRLMRFTPNGQFLDVFVKSEGEMPATRLGRIDALCVMNNWLVALVNAQTTGGARPTLLMWQEEGWHLVTALPNERGPTALSTPINVYYDRGTSSLWISLCVMGAMRISIPDYAINPFNGGSWQAYSWVEQDKFFGGQALIDKSWESVTIVSDNLDNVASGIDVFWQDEYSTDWELLGSTGQEEVTELRWEAPYTTRPTGKWIKLGLRFWCRISVAPLRVRSVIVKFLPIVADRVRDTVTLVLADNAQLPDGTRSPYTLAQQWTHLQSMIQSVNPIIYRDPLGAYYEVMAIDYSATIPRFAYRSGEKTDEMHVTLVLEQVPVGNYTPTP
jgi:hypothetical protein